MDVIPLGHSAFKLKGKKASVITDPYNPEVVGLKFPRHTSGDVITISHNHEDHNFINVIVTLQGEEKPVVLSGPGEYEIKGIEIIGAASFHDQKGGSERGKNTIFRIDIDRISIVHCGDLGHTLTDSQVDQIDNTDILLIPVGGVYTIDAHQAAEVVRQLEPRIVIPMHYQREGLNQKIFSGLAPVSQFLKEIGHEGVLPQPKLTLTKDKLPEELQIVVLE